MRKGIYGNRYGGKLVHMLNIFFHPVRGNLTVAKILWEKTEKIFIYLFIALPSLPSNRVGTYQRMKGKDRRRDESYKNRKLSPL